MGGGWGGTDGGRGGGRVEEHLDGPFHVPLVVAEESA
jgi:hypothetical protein